MIQINLKNPKKLCKLLRKLKRYQFFQSRFRTKSFTMLQKLQIKMARTTLHLLSFTISVVQAAQYRFQYLRALKWGRSTLLASTLMMVWLQH